MLFERRSRYDTLLRLFFKEVLDQEQKLMQKLSKLVTTIVSTFTAYYVHLWSTYFPDQEMQLTAPLPSFDGRAVQYPSVQNLRDYMSWRQVDCMLWFSLSSPIVSFEISLELDADESGHINNLYNTTFWTLIQKGGLDAKGAEKELAVSYALISDQ